jgi:hypothetical protein
VFFHELGHIEADQGFIAAEHKLGQGARNFGFADARRAEEQERADGTASLFLCSFYELWLIVACCGTMRVVGYRQHTKKPQNKLLSCFFALNTTALLVPDRRLPIQTTLVRIMKSSHTPWMADTVAIRKPLGGLLF